MRMWPDELNHLSTLNHRDCSLVGSKDYMNYKRKAKQNNIQ